MNIRGQSVVSIKILRLAHNRVPFTHQKHCYYMLKAIVLER